MTGQEIARSIRRIAEAASRKVPPGSPASPEAQVRRTKPMDYLRCLEFPLAAAQLALKPGMRVLDVASPQWFCLFLAERHPDVQFEYVNIMDSEIDVVRRVAEALGMKNVHCRVADARALPYEDGEFDAAVSISAVEHIDPDVGGDVQAFRDIRRVLRPGAEFVVSLPFNDVASLVYDDKHPVWERAVQKRNFYMRNYDAAQLSRLAEETDFRLRHLEPMYERPGLFALQYWEGGPGKQHPMKNSVMKLKKKIDKASGLRLEGVLSRRYLRAGAAKHRSERLVNMVATFAKD